MNKPEPTPFRTAFVLLWLLAVALEVPVLAQLAEHGLAIPPLWVVVMHLAAAAAMFLAPPREKGWFRPTRHWAQPLGLMALFVPGAGCVLGGCLFILHPVAHHDKEAYRFEDEQEDDASWLASLGTASAIRQELSEALDVVPAVDALIGSDPSFKRGAIEILAKIRSPDAIGWIVKARTDRDPETRFYATSALAMIQRDFDTAIHSAERDMFHRPGQLGPQLALHRVRYDYARSGLLEEEAADNLLRQSAEWLATPAEHDKDALLLLHMVERHLDPGRSLATLERLERDDPQHRPRWLREKVSLLFELGRYAETRRLMLDRQDEFLKEGDAALDPELAQWRSAALWWTHA